MGKFDGSCYYYQSLISYTYSTPPAPTHNYETVLPNFSTKLPSTNMAQNYEVPLTKAATLPRDMSQMDEETEKTMTLPKFSQSEKVRHTGPEAVYMNVTTTPAGEDMCAINPWNHHHYHQQKWNTYQQGGNGTVTDNSGHLVAPMEMRQVSPGDPWAT